MNDARIASLVDSLAAELSALVRAAALDAVNDALEQRAVHALRRRGFSNRGPTANPKRTPEEIEATAARLLAHVQAHPGERIEAIAESLRTTTRTLTLPMRRLVAAGTVIAKGRKRATRYWTK